MQIYRLALIFLILQIGSATFGPRFWPEPNKYTIGNDTFIVDPCKVNYKITTVPVYLVENVNLYLIEAFKCKKNITKQSIVEGELNVSLVVTVINTSLVAPFAGYENYTLVANSQGNWSLRANYYAGFLRGFETFAQLFKQFDNDTYYVEGLPINVTDSPQFSWRGIMIDTARHYLPVDTIKRTLDGCLYNKVNVMHWHITDEDSFPLEIKSHPELTKYGSFNNQTYTKENVLEIVQYALRRGVRVIPEIDSPAHTEAWGRSPQLSKITLNCGGPYTGQFDPTLNETYKVVEDVLREVDEMFIDPVMHLGGDEVDTVCWDKRPEILVWMAQNGIKDYHELQIYYRNRQKQIWRNISKTKNASYWANEEINLPTQSDDYIHWWGVSKNVRSLENRTNNIILSNYDVTYLDIGFGGRMGGTYGSSIETWKQMYDFQPNIPNIKGKILGGQACLWSQVNNQYTQQRKLWLRASAIAQRLWNSKVPTTSFRGIVDRLAEHGRRLRQRNIPFSPITVELCEHDSSICF